MAGILLDLDGVLYVGDEPVPGAAEAIAWLDREAVPYRYLTNTTSRPRDAIVARLGRMGIAADASQILTPAVAAAGWLRRAGIERPALFVPDATGAEFAGFAAPRIDEEVGALVVGDLGDGWDFAIMNRAFRLLMAHRTIPFVALGMTRFWRAEDGLRLDVGGFVRALEYAADRTAVVLGKPAADFYQAAVDDLGDEAADVVMVGDDIRGDVGGAQDAGLSGILVRTGKFAPHDLEGDVVPDAVLDSIADLPGWWSGRRRGGGTSSGPQHPPGSAS